MQHLGMVGVTTRGRGQDLVARLTVPAAAADRDAHLLRMHRACDFQESVYLGTCNRVEVVFVGRPGVDCADYRRRLHQLWLPEVPGEAAARDLHAYAGEGAAERLFVVAAAIDSMNPGEAQVLGQVKAAYHESRRLGLAGPQLAAVFEEAFAVAKRVRQRSQLGVGNVSMVSLARRLVEGRLARLGRTCEVVVVGTGAMGVQAAALFQGRDDVALRLVSRSLAPAQALAERVGGRAQALDAFVARPGSVDIMVTATGAPAPLFAAPFFQRLAAPTPLIVDLNVAHDVAPQAAFAAGVELWDIDKLAHLAEDNRRRRQGQLAAARAVVDEALEAFARRHLARQLAPAVTELRAWLDGALAAALPELPDLPAGPDDEVARQEALARWSARAARRLAHAPTRGLKALGLAHGPEAVATFVAALVAAPRGAARVARAAE